MKASEIREMSIADIQEKLVEEKANYQNMKMSHKVAQLENPIAIRDTRKNIARMATILNEKQQQA